MQSTEDISQMDITTDTAEFQPTSEESPKETSAVSQTPTEATVPARPSHSSKKAKSKNKKKPAAKPVVAPDLSSAEPDKSLIESKEEMHDRLKNGTEFDRDRIKGLQIAGTVGTFYSSLFYPCLCLVERVLGNTSTIPWAKDMEKISTSF
jgi:hypothetical protein